MPEYSSEFEIGDEVDVVFGDKDDAQRLTDCKIVRIEFSKSIIDYDIEVPIETGGEQQYTTYLRNVDGTYVVSPGEDPTLFRHP